MPPKNIRSDPGSGGDDVSRTTSACRIEVSPREVDAGGDLTLKGQVSLSSADDLQGQSVLIEDHDGGLVETTVVAVDAERHTPVRGAKVVMHPYRAVTDKRGVAEVRVPKGAYRLFVSGPNHVPFRRDGEMTTAVTIRAELALDLGISDADIWS